MFHNLRFELYDLGRFGGRKPSKITFFVPHYEGFALHSAAQASVFGAAPKGHPAAPNPTKV
jgi:hypothetical protein